MEMDKIKELAKLVSRYDSDTDEWEYLEIIECNALNELGLSTSEMVKVKSKLIKTTLVMPNGDEIRTEVIPVSAFESILLCC